MLMDEKMVDDMFRVWAWRLLCILRVLVCISKVLGLPYESLVYANGETGLRSSTFHVPNPTFSSISRWILIPIMGVTLLS